MFLQVQDISKSFEHKSVLSGINFSLSAHQTLSILGKSGCGKSTLLKILAGLIHADSGTIKLCAKEISNCAPSERNIVYLFQEALLFPHLSVFENVAFGLRIRKTPEQDLRYKVMEMLDSLQLEEHAGKMPNQLSGGQKQRVAFGRALIIKPPLILLDEPFSSLDIETRGVMQQLYKTIAAKFNLTALFVTHDLKEALLMGNQIAYMENGELEVFASKDAFVNSDKTGVKQEINFWNSL